MFEWFWTIFSLGAPVIIITIINIIIKIFIQEIAITQIRPVTKFKL